jgi:biopolymer transport protein TolQ
LTFLSAVAAEVAGPTRLDPLELFLDADIIVQAVMVGLILASIWSWAIIIAFFLRLGRLNGASREYERDFWSTNDREGALARSKRAAIPSARVAGAGLDEWKRSTKNGSPDKAATREPMNWRVNLHSWQPPDQLRPLLVCSGPFGGL